MVFLRVQPLNGRRMNEGGKKAVPADEEVIASSKVRELERRVRELERVLGKKTLENEILHEAVKIANKKKPSRVCRR